MKRKRLTHRESSIDYSCSLVDKQLRKQLEENPIFSMGLKPIPNLMTRILGIGQDTFIFPDNKDKKA